MVTEHLIALDERRRRELFGMITTMYNLRILADYVPSTSIEEADARHAGGLMLKVTRLLKEARDGANS